MGRKIRKVTVVTRYYKLSWFKRLICWLLRIPVVPLYTHSVHLIMHNEKMRKRDRINGNGFRLKIIWNVGKKYRARTVRPTPVTNLTIVKELARM